MTKAAVQNAARIINLSVQNKQNAADEQILLCKWQTCPPAVAK
ncbi:MAG: hypothetical protein ACFNTA_04180 [Campylobacter sp.]